MLNTFRLLAVSCAIALWGTPGSVWAQAGGGSQPPAGGGQGSGTAQKPAEQGATQPPEDTGPKPAGVGGSAPASGEPGGQEPPAPADQQAPSPRLLSGRPFSGVFGGAAPPALRRHRLDLSASAYGVRLFGNQVAIVGGGTDVLPLDDPTYAGAAGSLAYGYDFTNGSISADAYFSQAYVPDYEEVGDPWIERWGVNAGAGYGGRLGRRGSWNTSVKSGYSPYLQQFSFFGGPPTLSAPPIGGAGLDLVVAEQPSIYTTGTAGLSYQVNRKSSVETYASVNHRTFTEDDVPSQYDWTVGARYRYQFSRYVGARAGYGYRSARYGFDDGSQSIGNHIIDAGLDGGYGRSYALARRTTFSFNVGSSIYAGDEFSEADDGFDPRTRFNVDASADLVHAWARTWSADAGYRRGVGYEVGFSQPLSYDTAFGAVGGLLAPRLDFSANVQYTTGAVGFSGANNGYDTASAVASLRSALTSNLAAYVQYFYYRYFYESGVALPPYLQSNLDRQGITVGLTAWVPLIKQRGRR